MDLLRLYAPEEIAEIMHVSVDLAKRRMASGRWPSVKPSRTRFMTMAQIQQAIDIESQPVTIPPPAPNPSGLSPRSRYRPGR